MGFVLKKQIKTLLQLLYCLRTVFHFSYLACILVIIWSAFLTKNNLFLSPGCQEIGLKLDIKTSSSTTNERPSTAACEEL